MNLLRTALIEKIGRDNGFEHEVAVYPELLTLGSARHRTRASIGLTDQPYRVELTTQTPALYRELERQFERGSSGEFMADSESELARLLHRTAALAQALPNQAETDYSVRVNKSLKDLPTTILGTEVERMVRQRVGQDVFRKAQMDYWGSACAVTGIAVPEVLRASHAKPWAECVSDAERLDVFNGFLLSANLDALFDRCLISFDDEGVLLASESIPESERSALGLTLPARLRWVNDQHLPYLRYHRKQFASPKQSIGTWYNWLS